MIEIEFNVPDTILDIDKLIEGSIDAVEETVADSLKDFKTTTATFDDPVLFTTSIKSTPQSITGSVSTDDENYVRLNDGFTVSSVVGKPMNLYPGYTPKTFPNIVRGRKGGNLDNRMWRSKRRGFTVQARHFDLAVASRNYGKFFQRVANAIKGATST